MRERTVYFQSVGLKLSYKCFFTFKRNNSREELINKWYKKYLYFVCGCAIVGNHFDLSYMRTLP